MDRAQDRRRGEQQQRQQKTAGHEAAGKRESSAEITSRIRVAAA
jgi:hypothetical protein